LKTKYYYIEETRLYQRTILSYRKNPNNRGYIKIIQQVRKRQSAEEELGWINFVLSFFYCPVKLKSFGVSKKGRGGLVQMKERKKNSSNN